MTPGLLMILGIIAIVVGIIGAVLNFFVFAKRTLNDFTPGSFGLVAVLHIFCGLLYGGGMLTLIGGFIWFLVTVAKSA